jgi:hypothetical protein
MLLSFALVQLIRDLSWGLDAPLRQKFILSRQPTSLESRPWRIPQHCDRREDSGRRVAPNASR